MSAQGARESARPPGARASSARSLSAHSVSAEHRPVPAVTDLLTLTGSLGLGGAVADGIKDLEMKSSWLTSVMGALGRRGRRRRGEGGGQRGSDVSASRGMPGMAGSAYVAATRSQERGSGRCLPQRPPEDPTLWIPRFLTPGLLVCGRIPFCCLW